MLVVLSFLCFPGFFGVRLYTTGHGVDVRGCSPELVSVPICA